MDETMQHEIPNSGLRNATFGRWGRSGCAIRDRRKISPNPVKSTEVFGFLLTKLPGVFKV